MLPAFVIAEVEVIDAEAFKLYGSRVAETVERYGGRYIARGGRIESLEGEPPKRVVISAWKSIEDPQRWYRILENHWNSAPYVQITCLCRRRTCSLNLIAAGATSAFDPKRT